MISVIRGGNISELFLGGSDGEWLLTVKRAPCSRDELRCLTFRPSDLAGGASMSTARARGRGNESKDEGSSGASARAGERAHEGASGARLTRGQI